MIRLDTPISKERINALGVGDQVEIYGRVLCGRDAVLPRIAEAVRRKDPWIETLGLDGAVIFHTAVSPAGIGPTTSNKAEIEESIPDLAAAGVRIHLGKGSLKPETLAALKHHGSVFAVTPPVSALFSHRTLSTEVIAFEEEGMEALFAIEVKGLPAIIAAAHGNNIFEK
jgi:fumarate hydratase subunit beta